MAIEERRGCGYRKVGGLYLMGFLLMQACDRLPLEIQACPTCGAGPRFTRAPAEIQARALWGTHTYCGCRGPCCVCEPPRTPSFLWGVGDKHYSPQSFLTEARMMGVSKRIAAVPRNLKVGTSVVYLSHRKAIHAGRSNGENLWKPAVFCAFVPQRIDKLVWQSEATSEAVEALERRGIMPVVVPDGDADHR